MRPTSSTPPRVWPPDSSAGPARLAYLDNLKVALIAGIIAMHAVLGYAGFMDVWSYTGVREVTLSPIVEGILLVAVSPFGFFVIPLLFLAAGLLSRGSLEHKGPAGFALGRLVRLGVPFVLYVLLIQPAVMYALEHPLGHASGSYWLEFLGQERQLDTGPLWFVGVLLIFSLCYAAVAPMLHTGQAKRSPRPITVRTLWWLVCAVAPASFLVRVIYPYGGESGFTDLNFWEWPACAAMFALGIAAAGRGWLQAVPDLVIGRSRTVALAAIGAMAVLLTLAGFLDLIEASMGGWNWAAVAFAGIEVVLTVFGSVWLLDLAQRRLHSPRRWASPAMSRSAYTAFVVQTPVLIGLAVSLRPIPLPAEAKAFLVAVFGVAASFGLARLLLRGIPGFGRVL